VRNSIFHLSNLVHTVSVSQTFPYILEVLFVWNEYDTLNAFCFTFC
jgi:hypothetical protein